MVGLALMCIGTFGCNMGKRIVGRYWGWDQRDMGIDHHCELYHRHIHLIKKGTTIGCSTCYPLLPSHRY